MLSKYTIALNGAAVLLFMIFWPPARRWFLSPLPYLAALLCAVIASPVLYWNATHEWISFTFQTSRRLEEASEFSLHILLGGVLCLLTPGIAAALVPALRARPATEDARAKVVFLKVFTLFPLIVFALFSLRHEPKINWTGPGFLVALPFIAHVLISPAVDGWSRFAAKSRRPTLVALALVYLLALGYLCIGIPGVPYSPQLKRYVGWQDLGAKVGTIAAEIEKTSGTLPLIVGMDKHFIGSELAFYTTAPDGSRPLPPERFAGRALFDMDSLMWMFWSKSARLSDTLILVSRGESDLNKPELYRYLEHLGPIERIETVTRGSISGVYYYRVARHYLRPTS
jgi:dolichol-phosphate mannosyltransferase